MSSIIPIDCIVIVHTSRHEIHDSMVVEQVAGVWVNALNVVFSQCDSLDLLQSKVCEWMNICIIHWRCSYFSVLIQPNRRFWTFQECWARLSVKKSGNTIVSVKKQRPNMHAYEQILASRPPNQSGVSYADNWLSRQHTRINNTIINFKWSK